MNIREKKDKQKQAQETVAQMFGQTGWKIIEEYFKQNLEQSYEGFLGISPRKLKEKQLEFRLYMTIIKDIYALGGMRWTYNGFQEIEEQVDDEKRKRREMEMKYFAEAQGEFYG